MKMQGEIVNKKSYNPFKMWGSWVGAGLIYILWFNLYLDSSASKGFINNLIDPIYSLFNFNLDSLYTLIIIFIIVGIGFLIGWGIHSLVRRFRK